MQQQEYENLLAFVNGQPQPHPNAPTFISQPSPPISSAPRAATIALLRKYELRRYRNGH